MNKFTRTILAGSLFLFLFFALQFTSCKEEEPAPPLAVTSFSPAKGDAGSTVTIKGVSFSSNPANNLVSFGTTPAIVTAATKTQLTVTVPAGIEKEKISVTVNDVSVASATDFIATNLWKPIANFPGVQRYQTTTFTINGKGYYGLGFPFSKNIWEYDPTNDTWTQKQDLPGVGRSDTYGFVINSKAYVIGGHSQDTQLREVWEYDPAGNNWTQKNDSRFLERSNAFAFAINSKGYIGGGYYYGSAHYLLQDFWEYDASSDTWTRKADSPEALFIDAFNFTIGSYGYVGGGDSLNPPSVNFTFYQYDPSQNKWNPKSNLPEEIGHCIYGFASDSKGYASGETKQLWQFDPAANTWTRKSDSPTYLDRTCGFSIGDYTYIVQGASEKAFRYAME